MHCGVFISTVGAAQLKFSYHAVSSSSFVSLTQVLEEESAQLRAELGLDPAAGPLPAEAPRFSKRARQMAPETELESDAAVFLQEAHAAHHRCMASPPLKQLYLPNTPFAMMSASPYY